MTSEPEQATNTESQGAGEEFSGWRLVVKSEKVGTGGEG